MSAIRARCKDFLVRHGMDASTVSPDEVLASFRSEMEAGLAGAPGSLAMLPTFINVSHSVPVGEPVIIIDAGGTNLRICTVVFSPDGRPCIENFTKHKMPGVGREVSGKEFYNTLCDFLAPVISRSDRIGFCFSYPCEIFPDRDGRLLYWTKEVNAPDVVGNRLGEHLLAELTARGHKGKQVVLLNDTVAALLAGKAEGERRRCSDYVGFILGTGTNTAYVEKNRNILKRTDLDASESQAINVESGNFAGCPQGDVDRVFDAGTANSGKQTFEKMISGVYLGPLALELFRVAASEGLFSPRAAKQVASWRDLTTKELNDFLAQPFSGEGLFAAEALGDGDREVLMHLGDAVIARAALLAAINIAAAVLKSGSGRNLLHPVCVNIDGSTFHKTFGIRSRVEEHLRNLLERRGIYWYAVAVKEAPIVGAAIAGLS